MGDNERETMARVSRLEEQLKLLRTLFINTKTNEMTCMRRALDRAERRRAVEEEWLEEDRVHEEGQRRLLEAQELLVESLLKHSVWTEAQPSNTPPKIHVHSPSDTEELDFKTESQIVTQKTPEDDVEFITKLSKKSAPAPPAKPQTSSISIADTIKSLQNAAEERPLEEREQEHEQRAPPPPQPQASSSSSSTGWIKPKAPKPNVKAKYFSVAPQNSNNTKTSPPPWVLTVTRTDKNQREAQKRMKQTTLLDMSHRSRGQSSVDLSTLSGYSGGERKVFKFGRSSSPPCAPPALEVPIAGQKRKSLEVCDDDDAFGTEDESLLQYLPMTAIVKDNKENEQTEEPNETVTNWDDETLFGDADFQACLEQGESMPQQRQVSPPTPPHPYPSPQKRQGVLSLRNKKKEQMAEANLNKSRHDFFRSTQEIMKEFDKIPAPTVPRFKFKPDKAIRKKAERKQLNGYDCPECKGYWDGVASQLGDAELQRLKNKCSKHRGMHQEAEYEGNTPPFFWREDFPSTEEYPHVDGVRSPAKS